MSDAPAPGADTGQSCTIADRVCRYFRYSKVLYFIYLVILASAFNTIWSTVTLFKTISWYSSCFLGVYVIMTIFAPGFGPQSDGRTSSRKKSKQSHDHEMREIEPSTMIFSGEKKADTDIRSYIEVLSDSEETMLRDEEHPHGAEIMDLTFEDGPVPGSADKAQDKDTTSYNRVSPDPEDIVMDDGGRPDPAEVIDLTSDNEPIPELEKCAENGWIVIHESPKAPYDYDSDPMGLYGGEEVDDRPSPIDFYRQDARTNQIYAKMAPTRAELVAKIAAREAEEKAASEMQLMVSKPAKGISTSGLPLQDDKGAIRELLNREYTLMKGLEQSISGPPHPFTELNFEQQQNILGFPVDPFSPPSLKQRPKQGAMDIFNPFLPPSLQERPKQEVMGIFDQWQKTKKGNAIGSKDLGLGKTNTVPSVAKGKGKKRSNLHEFFDTSNESASKEESDLRAAIIASEAEDEAEEVEYQKAIRASVALSSPAKRKRSDTSDQVEE